MPRLIAALLFLAASVFAQPKVEFEHYRLPNGMQVILHPDHTAPLVTSTCASPSAPNMKRRGGPGFAHLFEHLMGENADAADGYMAAAEAIGATGINAGTHADYTDYYETVPASRLERMLWLESESVGESPAASDPGALRQRARDRHQRAARKDRQSALRHRRIRSFTASFFLPAIPTPTK